MPAPAATRGVFADTMTLSFFEELDFDDGPATEPQEKPSRTRRRFSRRGGRGGGDGGGEPPDDGDDRPRSTRPRPQGVQWTRIVLVFGALILLIVFAILWIRSCQDAAQKRAYRDYVAKVNSVVAQSNRVARSLDAALLNTDLTSAELVRQVGTLATQQAAAQSEAEGFNDTGRLHGLQFWLRTVMQYRTRGMQAFDRDLAVALEDKAPSKTHAAQVSRDYQILMASDPMYAYSFKAPAYQELNAAGVHDAPIRDSVFALTPEYVVPTTMQETIAQFKSGAGSTGSGGTPTCPAGVKIGTALVSTIVSPSGKALIPGTTLNKIVSTTSTSFVVTVKNSGEQRVTNVQVRFIEPHQITKTRTIKFLDPGLTGTATFKPARPTFQAEKLRIEVPAVPCETYIGNNSASYTVIFTP
jgi:hypothetical protein